MNRRAIAIYVALAWAVSWCLQLLAIRLFGLEAAPTRIVFVIVMWSPTLLALGFIAFHQPARTGIAWRLGRWAYLPLGVAVETAIGFAVMGTLVAMGLARSGWFAFGPDGVQISGGPWVLGRGAEGWPLYVLNVGATAVVFSAFNLVASTGEEFAWRGFLQGHLARQFGVRRGILLLAAVWWLWHLPGLLAGYDFPRYPLLGALVLFPLQMIGASLFFGWLTIRARSFWPAALAHGAVNSIQEGVVSNLHLAQPLVADGLRTGFVLVVGLICWFALRPPPEAVEPVDSPGAVVESGP